MPEGPEVRRHALKLAQALENQPLVAFTARTKNAKQWLLDHPTTLLERRVEVVRSHGKHLYGTIEGGFGFHCHLLMWGRWEVFGANENPEIDRRERARIVVPNASAVVYSAPIFGVFEGEPYQQIENLSTLGPDILPYENSFDAEEFVRRLKLEENLDREIGAVLLDQRVAAGIGNYLRADMLFFCQIDPWKTVRELSPTELEVLCQQIPLVAARSLRESGISIPDDLRERLLNDATLSYNGRIVEWGARHAVFRRTNLPCLHCGEPIRQKQQVVYRTPDGDPENEAANEKARIIYFCPNCQGVAEHRFEKVKTKRVRAPKKVESEE